MFSFCHLLTIVSAILLFTWEEKTNVFVVWNLSLRSRKSASLWFLLPLWNFNHKIISWHSYRKQFNTIQFSVSLTMCQCWCVTIIIWMCLPFAKTKTNKSYNDSSVYRLHSGLWIVFCVCLCALFNTLSEMTPQCCLIYVPFTIPTSYLADLIQFMQNNDVRRSILL